MPIERLCLFVFAGLGLSFAAVLPTQAQQASPSAQLAQRAVAAAKKHYKPRQTKTAKDAFKLHGRLQTGWQLTGDTRTGSWADSLYLRRARLGAEWEALDWVKLNLELKLALTGIELRDTFARLKLPHGLGLRLGYFKKPFSRLRMMSSFDLAIPERGLLDDNVVKNTKYGGFGNRDLGLMVDGDFDGPSLWQDPLKFSYALGLFNNLPTDSNYHRDLVGRAQLRLFKGLVLAANGSFKFYAESDSAKTAALFGGDLKWELGDFRMQLEGAVGDNVNLGSRLWGAHTTLSYRVPLAGLNQDWLADWVLTPAIMAEAFDPDLSASDDLDLRLAAALNLDLNANLRVVLGIDRTWSDVQAGNSAIPDPVRILLQTNLRF